MSDFGRVHSEYAIRANADTEIDRWEAECDRLRGLLFVARHGLGSALAHLRRYGGPYASGVGTVSEALRRSDPDATAEDGGTDAD